LYDTISNNEVLILSQTRCVYAIVHGDQHSVPKVVQLKITALWTKKARHCKQHLFVAAELPPPYRTTTGLKFVSGMKVSVNCRLLRQRFTFGSGPIYTVFLYILR